VSCFSARTDSLDEAICAEMFKALKPAELELALAAVDQLEQRDQAVMRPWQMRIERAEYECALAERRYEEVDPANRLVAASLERRWNEALTRFEEIRAEAAKQRAHMPGSTTTSGHPGARDCALRRFAFRYTDRVGTRNQLSIVAQWLACTYPCRRFADILADACAWLGADVVRYSFIAVDLHHLLLASLPAHPCQSSKSPCFRKSRFPSRGAARPICSNRRNRDVEIRMNRPIPSNQHSLVEV
jgi:hypothetical protein